MRPGGLTAVTVSNGRKRAVYIKRVGGLGNGRCKAGVMIMVWDDCGYNFDCIMINFFYLCIWSWLGEDENLRVIGLDPIHVYSIEREQDIEPNMRNGFLDPYWSLKS